MPPATPKPEPSANATGGEMWIEKASVDVRYPGLQGILLQEAVFDDYSVRRNVTLQFFDDDGAQTIVPHPENVRKQEAIVNHYARLVRDYGVIPGVRGEPRGIQSDTASGMPALMVTYGTLSRAVYKAAKKWPENKMAQVSLTRGLRNATLFDSRAPKDVIRWLRDWHSEFHNGSRFTLLQYWEHLSDMSAEYQARGKTGGAVMSFWDWHCARFKKEAERRFKSENEKLERFEIHDMTMSLIGEKCVFIDPRMNNTNASFNIHMLSVQVFHDEVKSVIDGPILKHVFMKALYFFLPFVSAADEADDDDNATPSRQRVIPFLFEKQNLDVVRMLMTKMDTSVTKRKGLKKWEQIIAKREQDQDSAGTTATPAEPAKKKTRGSNKKVVAIQTPAEDWSDQSKHIYCHLALGQHSFTKWPDLRAKLRTLATQTTETMAASLTSIDGAKSVADLLVDCLIGGDEDIDDIDGLAVALQPGTSNDQLLAHINRLWASQGDLVREFVKGTSLKLPARMHRGYKAVVDQMVEEAGQIPLPEDMAETISGDQFELNRLIDRVVDVVLKHLTKVFSDEFGTLALLISQYMRKTSQVPSCCQGGLPTSMDATNFCGMRAQCIKQGFADVFCVVPNAELNECIASVTAALGEYKCANVPSHGLLGRLLSQSVADLCNAIRTKKSITASQGAKASLVDAAAKLGVDLDPKIEPAKQTENPGAQSSGSSSSQHLVVHGGAATINPDPLVAMVESARMPLSNLF
ncbi:unnamed protein product, partial [Prorocentrum cordatum]